MGSSPELRTDVLGAGRGDQKATSGIEELLEVNSEILLQTYSLLSNSFHTTGICNFAFQSINILSSQFRNTDLQIYFGVRLLTLKLMCLFWNSFPDSVVAVRGVEKLSLLFGCEIL